MTEIPLILKLKKQNHKELAEAQDIMIENIFDVDDAVLHGGTAIWRCYKGKRFSEDIDLYLPNDKNVKKIFQSFENSGLIPIKKKVTKNSVYSKFKFKRVIVRFEALFKTKKNILIDYKLIDGNLITIYSLSAEELILEKILAYQNRLKIRDLYDIFLLLKKVNDKSKIKKYLVGLINKFKSPIDESDLKYLIIEGIAPTSKKMLEYIKKWV
ncbi:nucleotidyl transferase AbiEii/AbiGii toxin family protein [Candidatus Woesearchaeota archaeon]|jgi:predicted nucleotidyltransferase component of viral defense system|nr:nucleotidyl transferase AbiEii/AbiGii toxin family protein [Candidatus Woesearchaeota archaeon]